MKKKYFDHFAVCFNTVIYNKKYTVTKTDSMKYAKLTLDIFSPIKYMFSTKKLKCINV